MARRKPVLGPLDVWKICALGRQGGYAHRYISSRLFGLVPEKLEKWQVSLISNTLHRNDIRVTDWRMGRTVASRAYADKVTTLVKGAAAQKKALEGLKIYVPRPVKQRKVKKEKPRPSKQAAG